MHGNVPTLPQYIIELIPQTEIDLQCHEQLNSSEDEDEDEVDHLQEQPQQARRDEQHPCYLIETQCCRCESLVQLAVQSSTKELRMLQQMLMGTVELVCPLCATRR
uniref:Protein E7 n=10 Tax=Human papillomavirus type 53 TaxID=333765 RepID=Q17UH2_HPV53